MRKWFSDLLHVPSDVMSGVPRIEMIGSSQLQVENYLRIDKFSNKEITLKIRDGNLAISGEDLKIKTIYPQFIFIEGAIQDIRYIT